MTLQDRLANVPGMFSEGVENAADAAPSRRGRGAELAERLRAAAASVVRRSTAQPLARPIRPSTLGA